MLKGVKKNRRFLQHPPLLRLQLFSYEDERVGWFTINKINYELLLNKNHKDFPRW